MLIGKPKYFFSYARKDTECVLKLATELRAAGVEIWLDQLDILGGQHWDRTVEEALTSCEGMIVGLSPDSSASNNVMDEISYALDKSKLVVPILLRHCDIPLRLRRLHHVDLTANYDVGFRQLLRALSIEPSSEATEPALDEAHVNQQLAGNSTPIAATTLTKPQEPDGAEPVTRPWAKGQTRLPEIPKLNLPISRRHPEPSIDHTELFPLYGVILGETTVEEIAKIGTEYTGNQPISEKVVRKLFSWAVGPTPPKRSSTYLIHGLSFWVNSLGIVESLSLVRDQFPEEWVMLGFSWRKSYNQWIEVLKRLGCEIETTEPPDINGFVWKHFIAGQVVATRRTKFPVQITLRFQPDAEKTLFSMNLKCLK